MHVNMSTCIHVIFFLLVFLFQIQQPNTQTGESGPPMRKANASAGNDSDTTLPPATSLLEQPLNADGTDQAYL